MFEFYRSSPDAGTGRHLGWAEQADVMGLRHMERQAGEWEGGGRGITERESEGEQGGQSWGTEWGWWQLT